MDWVSKITCELLRNYFCSSSRWTTCYSCMADKVSVKLSLGCILDGNMHHEASWLTVRFSWAWATKRSSAHPLASHKDHIILQFYILRAPTNQVGCKTCLGLCKRCMNIADELRRLTAFSLHGNKLLSAQLQMMAKKFPHAHFLRTLFLLWYFLAYYVVIHYHH